MSIVKTIASGSSGNCYILDDGQTEIMLDCGLTVAKMREALDYRAAERIKAVFITHEHKDHCKGAVDLMKDGIGCVASKGTWKALGVKDNPFSMTIKAGQMCAAGTWAVYPFEVEHDAEEPLGYVCESGSDIKVLYITDTKFTQYRFYGLTHIIIECNYDDEALAEAVDNGRTELAAVPRLYNSHMSLQNCLEFFKANDMSKVKEIWLAHISSRNANAAKILREVKRATGIETHICNTERNA